MPEVAEVLTGFVAGGLAGAFGLGGGIVMTPAIRVLLGYPALIAVGTPLAVVFPTAMLAASTYVRRSLADVRTGLKMGVAGAVTAGLGAYFATAAGGRTVLLLTSALIAWLAALMVLRRSARAGKPEASGWLNRYRAGSSGTATELGIGAATGLLSGFLGLGGGFFLVPALVRGLGLPMKRAVGTSLVAIAVLSAPGAVAHWVLGNVDVRLGVALAAGAIPGTLVGARLTALARERSVELSFAAFLGFAALTLAFTEVWGPR